MPVATQPLRATVRPRLPVELWPTLSPLRRGVGDPSVLVEPSGAWWRASRTPLGPATTRIEQTSDGIEVLAWGPGGEWALAAAPDLLGTGDSLDGFEPRGVVRDLHRRRPGLRILRSRAVFEALVPTILEQKVVGAEARRSYRAMLLAWGDPAPGPTPLRVPPHPGPMARRAGWEFHPLGVEGRRAAVIHRVAMEARRLEELCDAPLAEAYRRLRAIPGVGPWTAAEVAHVAMGDADAVSVGDYHLPNLASWILAGEPRGSDERMLELLEPYRGHRGRVLRLLALSGMKAPRHGPRMPLRSIERL